MEFKGTKGKWAQKFGDVFSDIQNDDDAICYVYNYSTSEGKANALLISKAPEMLEMLQTIAKGFDDSKKHLIIKKAEKLIKEATEFK